MDDEVPLEGGNATVGVVRIGSTVRKPWRVTTPAVFEYMTALASQGLDVPAPLGRDEKGRQIVEFVPGHLAMATHSLTLPELARVGHMVRAIHDASENFVPIEPTNWDVLIPAEDSDLICHNDLAPWNLLIGDRWVFIDWDGAGPSSRLWDLAYTAQAFTLSDVKLDPQLAATRLAALINGYGAEDSLRESLLETMARRAAAMHDLLLTSNQSGREPWGSMYATGHGSHWHDATRYVEQHREVWTAALLHPAG